MAKDFFAESLMAHLQELHRHIVAEHLRCLQLVDGQAQVALEEAAWQGEPYEAAPGGASGCASHAALSADPAPQELAGAVGSEERSQEGGGGEADSAAPFALHKLWKDEAESARLPKQLCRTLSRMSLDLKSCASMPGDDVGSSTRFERLANAHCRRYVTHPNSKKRLIWDIIGLICICYDIVVLPLQVFEMRPTPFLVTCDWITLAFWSIDLPGSFLVGYHTKGGILVTSITRIAKKYLFSWFPLDILVITIDWTLVFMGLEDLESASVETAGLARFGKTMRVIRLLRMLRLMRLAKLPRYFVLIEEHIQSEVATIMIRICKLTACVLVINHLVACCWFAIGNISDGQPTWLTEFKFMHADTQTLYATSLHWSLTQFTPASMEVFPQNIRERSFTLVVVVFALITFSSFVSSITNAMTHLCNMNSEYAKQFVQLSRYLRFHKIPTPLAVRVRRHVARTVMERQQRLEEDEVALFTLLSKPLLMDLRLEVHRPLLEHHPFFQRFCEANMLAMRKVCCIAIAEFSLAAGDLLFSPGEVCERMYFLKSGALRYYAEGAQSACLSRLLSEEEVLPSEWISEACLWTKWRHCGLMHASAASSLIALDAEKFHEVARQTRSPHMQPAHYAQHFVRHLNSLDPSDLTDLTLAGFDADLALAASDGFPAKADSTDMSSAALSLHSSSTGDQDETMSLTPASCSVAISSRASL